MADTHRLPNRQPDLIHVPPYLKPGDTIGITSPAGMISPEEIQPCVTMLEGWGFKVLVGTSIGKAWGTFGGTDAERAGDLQAMLDNDAIAAILCARGGYGLVRIIDQLNFAQLQRHPKWLVGFSDVTVLHSHLNSRLWLATLHSKMCSGFSDEDGPVTAATLASVMSIRNALTGQAVEYPISPNAHHRSGVGIGAVVGGNLRTLETLTGTASEIRTDNAILLVEDTGEPLYAVDRMFWHLKRSGRLSRLAGLLVGGFSVPPDSNNDLPFVPDLVQIVMEKVRDYHYPVCFDFPVGHQSLNLAVKLGVLHQLVVKDGIANLTEMVRVNG